MRLLHVRPLQINPGPADGDIQLIKDRGFWWLFETDDEDVPIVSLQYDLAGRKARKKPPQLHTTAEKRVLRRT